MHVFILTQWRNTDNVRRQLMKTFSIQQTNPMRGIDTYAHNVHIMSNMLLVMRPREQEER